MTDDSLSRDLEHMADNPATARAIRSALERLAGGAAGGDLAEMSQDILDGRIELRDIGRSAAYANPLTDAIGQFQQWQADLTEDERNAALDEARRQLGLDESPPSPAD
jgi:hypothetical protein